jgi:endonuclease-3 related protein
MRPGGTRLDLQGIYGRLRDRYGHAGWWPGESAFEVCLGAILTQNTAWSNVEKALAALRAQGLLTYEALKDVPRERLGSMIRAAGTYNIKAVRLGAFLAFLGRRYGGRVEAMAAEDAEALRQELLEVPGIGPETADAIVLYAAGLPVFVVDAYTRRVFTRLGLLRGGESYDEIQRWFMRWLPRDAELFNDYHAQIVRLAKDVCRPRPRCASCPLDTMCIRRGVEPLAHGRRVKRSYAA